MGDRWRSERPLGREASSGKPMATDDGNKSSVCMAAGTSGTEASTTVSQPGNAKPCHKRQALSG